MKKISYLHILLIGYLAIYAASCRSGQIRIDQWQVSKTATTKIAWTPFTWQSDSLGNRYYEKSAMFIPLQLQGLPYHFTFQFDLGSNASIIYENNFKAVLQKHSEMKSRLITLNKKENQKAFKNTALVLNGYLATNTLCYVAGNYGEEIPAPQLNTTDTFHLGTIGADLFQNKILLLDYPNKQFAICDSLPSEYQTPYCNITLDPMGRIILPMKLNGKNFRIMFDNGSSIFPLITSSQQINDYSSSPATDTIPISSWGTIHNVIGRPLIDSFELGGCLFANTLIYADYRKEAKSENYDGITGNALFWNKTLIIDFKNKKFGIK